MTVFRNIYDTLKGSFVMSTCLAVALVSLVGWFVGLMQTEPPPPKPLHETETAAAWASLQNQQYQEAVQHADKCIREFFGDAKRKQLRLEKSAIPLGIVSPEETKRIHLNGTLNDVATCYYIKGRALTELGKKDLAAKSLAEATKYSAARAYDPRGWFWSPAEAAQLYLTNPELVDKALHEIYTAKAWEAFNAGNYEQAVLHAEKCIGQFAGEAGKLQQKLKTAKVQLPDGVVTEKQKQAIQRNGILNDVATCCYINGQSAENLRDFRGAAAAYHKGRLLSYGRCWDPNGWFWTPALKCSDNLERLK